MQGISKDNEKYSFCEGHNCKYNNNVLIKRVYRDFLYLPLCDSCIRNYERKINMIYNKKSEYLDKKDIAEVYFKNIGLI